MAAMTLTPAAINKYVKSILDNDKYLGNFVISGELSNVKYHSNGNIYFRIKDDEAQIDCTMFRSYASNNEFKLEDGQKVLAQVSLTTIVKMGKYSLNVRKIKQDGQGDLHLLYRKLFAKLETDGLFDSAHKKEIPKFPKRIAVVTSPTGAAILDIISTLKRRYPIGDIVVIPCLVQGEKASQDIVKKLELADEMDFDVIICGRGGGSIEDLWAFNEENVANAVFNLKTPIISSVGHETDTTIIDYVADLRAPTPTAAAELAAVNINEISERVDNNLEQIRNLTIGKIRLAQSRLDLIKANRNFEDPILAKKMIFDGLTTQFEKQGILFEQDLKYKQQRLAQVELDKYIDTKIKMSNISLQHIHEQIDQLNPLAILSRGYNTVKQEGKYIKSINEVEINSNIEISFRDGTVTSKVITKEKNE